MQDGRNAGGLRAKRVWEMFREVPEVQGWRGQEAGLAAGRSAGGLETVQGEGGLRLAEEPGKMQEQERSCKQGCQAPLVPMGAGLGHRLGSRQGSKGRWAQDSSQQEGKSWNAGQSPSLIHCGRGEGGQTEKEAVGGGETRRDKGQEGETDRREQGQGVSKAALASPSMPPSLSQTPTHRLS